MIDYFQLGHCVGIDPQREHFALPIPTSCNCHPNSLADPTQTITTQREPQREAQCEPMEYTCSSHWANSRWVCILSLFTHVGYSTKTLYLVEYGHNSTTLFMTVQNHYGDWKRNIKSDVFRREGIKSTSNRT